MVDRPVSLFDQYQKQAAEITCVDWFNSARDINHVYIEIDIIGRIPFDADRFDTPY